MVQRLLKSVVRAFATALLLSGCGSQVEHGNVSFDVAPDGQQIVFSSADGDIYSLDLKTLRVRQLTQTEITATDPTFSPDMSSIAYAADTKGTKGMHIFVRSLDGRRVRQLTDDPNVSDRSPSYSPDGAQIAFARAHRYRPYSMGGKV